ncbi:cytosolic glucose-6-phosphate isomerase [Gracilaria domingensis]|nr:cytosolic glucose-6-phosphate isomerase [Gracilaria domingensis]
MHPPVSLLTAPNPPFIPPAPIAPPALRSRASSSPHSRASPSLPPPSLPSPPPPHGNARRNPYRRRRRAGRARPGRRARAAAQPVRAAHGRRARRRHDRHPRPVPPRLLAPAAHPGHPRLAAPPGRRRRPPRQDRRHVRRRQDQHHGESRRSPRRAARPAHAVRPRGRRRRCAQGARRAGLHQGLCGQGARRRVAGRHGQAHYRRRGHRHWRLVPRPRVCVRGAAHAPGRPRGRRRTPSALPGQRGPGRRRARARGA